MAGQFPTTITDYSTNHHGRRAHPARILVVHTFEGQDLPVERMTDYQSGRLPHQRTGSYHVVVDADGRSGRENDNGIIPWAAGWTANRIGLHVSLAGRAAFSRETWLSRVAQLSTLARWLAHESIVNDIPLEVVPIAGIRGNGRGVCSHADISRAFPGETDHTDPGPHFPWDRVLENARTLHARATGHTDERTGTMDPRQAHQLDDITGQLTGSRAPGEFPGWPQLGDRTLVDAVALIGLELGISGFIDPRETY